MPEIPVVPLLGGLAGLAVIGALVWFFVLRTTPPELASVTPTTVGIGEDVTLTGRHLGRDAASTTVFFGPMKGQVREAGPTQLKAVALAESTARSRSSCRRRTVGRTR
jgi:hypothetical protein